MAVKLKTKRSMDRISNLPDVVLCHILSFLPTKQVVRNSILSTRCKYLFASVTNLDFVYSLWSHTGKGNENEKTVSNISSFINFVDRVLFLHNASCIDRFRLKCKEAIDSCCFNAWVCAALCRNVQELNLCVYKKESSMLPVDLFTSKTLVVLKLNIIFFVLNVPAKVCLPSLKILRLDSIIFSDDDSIERLFSSCLVLEALVLVGCEWKNICKFDISSHTLKRLTIEYSCAERHDYSPDEYEIVVNAPSLVYLTCNGYLADSYSFTNLCSLVGAHIDVKLCSLSKTADEFYAAGTEFVRGISNVRSLYLSNSSMKAIQLCCHPLPVFQNMTHLHIGAHKHTLVQGLPDFLKRSPNLQTLVFEGLVYGKYSVDWNPPEDVPSCLLFHLKEIEICVKGWEQELKMIEYCMKNAKVLKKFTIHTSACEKEQLRIANDLLMLQRQSKKCRITIH